MKIPKIAKIIYYITIVIISPILEGCSYDTGERKQQETAKINKSIVPIFDLNNDGISDITYKYDKAGYSEFIDRNFDKKIDQVNRYNLKDTIINSRPLKTT